MLGLIPARKNSKGIPHKNIALLCGRPLIAWTIDAALQSTSIEQVIVSTDCTEIARIAEEHGAEVPFMRPAELARDDTPGIEPVLHACEQIPDREHVVLLQPTSPLRTAEHLEAAIQRYREQKADFLVSTTVPKHHPNWLFHESENGYLAKLNGDPLITHRQQLERCLALNGAIYIANRQKLLASRTFLTASTISYEMSPEDSIDVDSPSDLIVCEALLNHRRSCETHRRSCETIASV